VDLNHRPRPYQGGVVRFYNNLRGRGDCQTTRKSYKTSHIVGRVVGWKESPNSGIVCPDDKINSRVNRKRTIEAAVGMRNLGRAFKGVDRVGVPDASATNVYFCIPNRSPI